MSHRRPPLAYSRNAPAGHCRLCGLVILEPRHGYLAVSRRHWHPECVIVWNCATSQSHLRFHVFRRDGGRCAGCETIVGDSTWTADHRIPLKLAPRDPWYWSLANVQTLCRDCNARKTAADQAAIAKQRRRERPRPAGNARARALARMRERARLP